jgi:diacylglycerol kinase family enzyme
VALLLVNAHAAGGRAQHALRRLVESARSVDPLAVPDPAITRSSQEARNRVGSLPPGARVVVAGGDGTLHALLPLIVARRLELAVLPLGSGNDFARSHGAGHRADATGLLRALRAPSQPADVLGVRLDGGPERLAASSAAIGFDAAVGARAATMPAFVGNGRYLLATLAELRRLRLWTLAVTIDGDRVHGTEPTLFASVLNTRTYGGGLPVAPAARVDDGRLDLVNAGRFGRLQALAMLPRLQFGRHVTHPRVDCRSGHRVLVQAEGAGVPVALDGEAQGAARTVEVSVLPRCLALVRTDTPSPTGDTRRP